MVTSWVMVGPVDDTSFRIRFILTIELNSVAKHPLGTYPSLLNEDTLIPLCEPALLFHWIFVRLTTSCQIQ